MTLPRDAGRKQNRKRPGLDVSIIAEVADDEAAALVSREKNSASELYALEETSLEKSKNEFEKQKSQIEVEHLKVQLENARQDLDLRKKFGRQILRYLWAFSLFCGACLILQGFGWRNFHLDDPILVTLVGGTAASAFGLVSVVLAGLFRSPLAKKGTL